MYSCNVDNFIEKIRTYKAQNTTEKVKIDLNVKKDLNVYLSVIDLDNPWNKQRP